MSGERSSFPLITRSGARSGGGEGVSVGRSPSGSPPPSRPLPRILGWCRLRSLSTFLLQALFDPENQILATGDTLYPTTHGLIDWLVQLCFDIPRLYSRKTQFSEYFDTIQRTTQVQLQPIEIAIEHYHGKSHRGGGYVSKTLKTHCSTKLSAAVKRSAGTQRVGQRRCWRA